jgi:ribosome-binding protein aMBF1 (putative translation factor)
MAQQTNTAGVPLSINGYVICRVCGKEVQGISKETSQEYAHCPHCRPKQSKENATMPTAPKPSQAKKDKKPVEARTRIAKPAKTKAPTNGKASVHVQLVQLAKDEGKLTPDRVRQEGEKRGLAKGSVAGYVASLKKQGLLDDSVKATAD